MQTRTHKGKRPPQLIRDARLLGLTEGYARRNRVLLYSPQLKEYLRESGVRPALVHLAIKGGREVLQNGKSIKAGKVTAKVGRTGKYKGQSGSLHLKVTTPNQVFFGKVSSEPYAARDHVMGLADIERFLRKRKHTIEGQRFRVVKPHLVYERRHGGQTTAYIVSDYFGKEKVMQMSNSPKKHTKPRKAIRKLRTGIRKQSQQKNGGKGYKDSHDVGSHNTFRDRKTGELLLFDADRSRTHRTNKPRK